MEDVLRYKALFAPSMRIVYDCEALFAEREFLSLSLQDKEPGKAQKEKLIRHEIELAGQADSITIVSEREKRLFTEHGIQNIHHFRNDALATDKAPINRIVVFDEAQRAWTREHTARFMKVKTLLDSRSVVHGYHCARTLASVGEGTIRLSS